MARQQWASSPTRQYVYLKRRISKNRAKAKFVGFLYLLGLFVTVALSCMGLISVNDKRLNLMCIVSVFTSGKIKSFLFLASVGYALTLVIMLICVIKCICSLKWLFKRKASKLYGFNRNAYAMDDMGKCFSFAFASAVSIHFLIALVMDGEVTLSLFAYAFLGFGVVLHLLCGVIGGTVSLFSTDGMLYEEKREVGSFAPFVRNVFQIALTATAGYFLVKGSTLRSVIDELIKGGVTVLTGNTSTLITFGLQIAIALWLVIMTGYIFSNKEYDPDGADATGRKSYLWLSLLLLLTAGGLVAFAQMVAKIAIDSAFITIAGIAFAGVFIELCLLRLPINKYEAQLDEVETGVLMNENYDDIEI